MDTNKALGQMTKDETYAEACRRGVRIVADVVLSRGRRPFTRLIGLVALLRGGHRVGVDCGALVIDGRNTDWLVLERAADEV